MANTITSQTLVDGSVLCTLNRHILGDGSGEETNTILVDASAFNTSNLKVMKVQSSLTGFSVKLDFDATANVPFLELPAGDSEFDFTSFGGISNSAGTGKTGDILFSTVGLGSGDSGSIILHLKKKG